MFVIIDKKSQYFGHAFRQEIIRQDGKYVGTILEVNGTSMGTHTLDPNKLMRVSEYNQTIERSQS
jgi:hypothetical protein